MRALMIAASLGVALCGTAFAGDPQPDASEPATEPATETPAATDAAAPAPPVDCATLTGDAKTACEANAATPAPDEATTPAAEKAPAKGKLKRSNTNRLESETEDE